MHLLLITRKVDQSDPILGFFHRWIVEFAKHSERVTVIAHSVGNFRFPANVRVFSLGKERGVGRLRQILRLWSFLWKERSAYDRVFVHMTPVHVVLGAPLWSLLRRPVYLWYEARGTRWPLKIALKIVRKVFSASVHGMPLPTPRSVIVGHGIDTDFFRPGTGEREPGMLLTVGRITRSKNVDSILHALADLPDSWNLTIAGQPITGDDCEFSEELWDFIHSRNLHNRVTVQCVTQDALLPLLQRAGIFVHASHTGLDKAVLEAMACACPVVSSSAMITPFLPEVCRATVDNFSDVVRRIGTLSTSERSALGDQLRSEVVRHHNLPLLIQHLVDAMSEADACRQ